MDGWDVVGLVVLRKVVPFQVIKQLATAGSHLEQPPAGVEVLAMRPQVLGQVIDASGEQGDLDFGRAGILIVDLIFFDDFWFNDCGGHGYVFRFTTVGNPLGLRAARPARLEIGLSRRHRSNPAEAGPAMVGARNRRASTDARK